LARSSRLTRQAHFTDVVRGGSPGPAAFNGALTGSATGVRMMLDQGAVGEESLMAERIEVNPNIHFGKPCVARTRIPVVDVLELVGQGIPFDQIIRDYYPDLETEDIRACIRYAIEVLGAEDLHIAFTP
jgi:uncharacterized protein (DUF433 family)